MYHPNETKDKILQAALKMLNEFGYGSLNISELARRSKVSKQNLYYHYPAMEDILIALADQWSSTGQECAIQALARSQELGPNKILAIARGMFDWMAKHEELSKLGLVLFQSGPQVKKLNLFMDKARSLARLRIRELLLQSAVFSKLKNAQLEEVITAVHSTMYGFSLYVFSMNDFKNIKLHAKNCNESLSRLLNSYS